jgi:hypothetical protein
MRRKDAGLRERPTPSRLLNGTVFFGSGDRGRVSRPAQYYRYQWRAVLLRHLS